MHHWLICDDHPLVAASLESLVAGRWPATQITCVADFPAAYAAAAMSPGLCLVDLDMPGAEPRQGVAALRAIAPAMLVVVITGSQDDALMMSLLADGVAGFVPKTSAPAVILAAIELVLAGGRYLPERMADAVAGSRRTEERDSPGPKRTNLTTRQIEVARLVAEGLSNKDIARRLELSPATVKTHVAQVIALLGAANRTDAAVKARTLGICD